MNTEDVKITESTETEGTEEAVQESEVKTEETTQVPGTKTDSALLLESLKEERAKRRELEAKLAEIPQSDVVYSDEGIALMKEIEKLKLERQQEREQSLLSNVLSKFPVLNEKKEEFDEYRKGYPVEKIESTAKLFLIEKGLVEEVKERKGLEPVRGTRQQPSQKLTADDVKELREKNFREYSKQVRSGKIKL